MPNNKTVQKNKVDKRPTKPDKSKECPDVIYLDNNATTLMCQPAVKVFQDWLSCYNPSSDSKVAKPAKHMLEKATDECLAHCNVSTATHTCIFTSGGTESNCLIIRSCVKAYKRKLLDRGSDLLPHIICSAVEHHSIIECLEDLMHTKDIDLTYVQPSIFGNILPTDVEKEIKTNTCLITIMYANNEVPIINNIKDISEIAHRYKVPIHTDAVQVFGKFAIDLKKDAIDAVSASSHKFYGPKGCGILIINNDLIEGYGLRGEINGTQQHGLRGGTENIAGIASTVAALRAAFVNRKKKNEKLLALRQRMLDKLKKHFRFNEFIAYSYQQPIENALELVSLGPPSDRTKLTLPNTILLAICKNKGKPFCNVELKKYLDNKKVIVSIGSACLTSSDKASHVLTAIGAPPVVKRGVIRISFSDSSTTAEVDEAVQVLKQGIEKQCHDLKLEEYAPIKVTSDKPA